MLNDVVLSVSGSSFNLIQIIDTGIKINDIIHLDSGDIVTSNINYFLFKWGMKGDFKNCLETSSCENLVLKNCILQGNKGAQLDILVSGGTRGVIDIFLNQIKIVHYILN